jgi:hypothetical protein
MTTTTYESTHGANSPDKTPKTFAELKPPGYWNGEYFEEVREVSEEEFWRHNDLLKDCIAVERNPLSISGCHPIALMNPKSSAYLRMRWTRFSRAVVLSWLRQT